MAGYADEAGVDLILVGDSVGTTQLGFETTIPVTLEMMLHHTAAVARAKPQALVVADIPFAVAHGEFKDLLEACRRLMQIAGAEAVKIEGGASMAPKIERLTNAGIPVLAHIGLLPQQFHQLGGYRKFGRSEAEKLILVADALALEKAGCFAVLCEMVGWPCGEYNCARVGATVDWDWQWITLRRSNLSHQRFAGMTAGHVPSFVKQYVDLGNQIRGAFEAYAEDVRKGNFPS